MTETTGTDPHPEVTELSDLTEGLLPPDRSAAVREHLADCEVCAEVLSALEEIRDALGTLPGPQRIPADVAGRIDAALAAEALLDSTTADVPRETSTDPVGPSEAGVPRGTSTGPAGRSTAPAGPGRPDGRRPSGLRNPRNWRRGLLATAACVAVAGLGYLVSQADSGSANNDAASTKSDTAAGRQADPIADQVRRLLATAPHQKPPVAPNNSGASPMVTGGAGHTTANGPASPTSVPACVLAGTGHTDPPLAAQRTPYQGTDAYLVVLPQPGDNKEVDAFVVDASCTGTAPGAVLFQRSYPRP
jgi:anti-sigma factor RsiW